MNIIVTGGGGYIGSILCSALLSNGHRVVALDTFQHGENSLAHLCAQHDFEIVRQDARNIDKAHVDWADVIIPLAAIVGADACKADSIGAELTNFVAIRDLCALVKDQPQKLIVIPTTNSGYGIGGEAFCTEESPLNPLSHYGRTKVAAEAVVLACGGISLRLATVFGASPRMRMDLLVNDFVYRAVTDRALVLFEGDFRRNYVHVRDVAGAFVHALTELQRGQAYNVGDTRANLSKRALCDVIAKQVPGFVYTDAEHGSDPDKRDYIVSNAKIEATGWCPRFSLDQGIAELITLYRSLRPRRYANV